MSNFEQNNIGLEGNEVPTNDIENDGAPTEEQKQRWHQEGLLGNGGEEQAEQMEQVSEILRRIKLEYDDKGKDASEVDNAFDRALDAYTAQKSIDLNDISTEEVNKIRLKVAKSMGMKNFWENLKKGEFYFGH